MRFKKDVEKKINTAIQSFRVGDRELFIEDESVCVGRGGTGHVICPVSEIKSLLYALQYTCKYIAENTDVDM